MITDIAFIDLDGDRKREVVAVGEWMPVTVLEFKEGKLKAKEVRGLDKTNGWWNCLEYGDFDNDGDLDLVAGNLGLNSIIRASSEQPTRLYVKDFDQNGTIDPLITCYRQNKSYPIANRDEMLMQIVSLRKKYVSYDSYAGKTIEEILTPEQLDKAIIKEAFTFESCYIENLGKGELKVVPLPKEVQVSPVHSFLASDVDKDGKLDLLCGGNFYGVGAYRGKYDAGLGVFLKGNGKGGFKSLSAPESGFLVTGEVREIKKIKSKNAVLYIVGRNNEEALFFK